MQEIGNKHIKVNRRDPTLFHDNAYIFFEFIL